MKLEDQVLSINQVQELQELRFDVEKYASMCWISGRLFVKNDETTRALCLTEKYIPTLTIGDIMEILPLYVKGKGNNIFWREITSNGILYYRRKTVDWVFNTFYEKPNKPLIEALFEALKWCIKEKHIAL